MFNLRSLKVRWLKVKLLNVRGVEYAIVQDFFFNGLLVNRSSVEFK